MRKVWLVGSKGQIGRAILHNMNKLNFEIVDTDIEDVDVTVMDDVMDFGDVTRPDIIINCVGLTDQEECERDRKKAFLINTITAKNLAILSKKLNCKFIHLSTDDVFDGTKKEAYSEFDEPNPQSVFGKSKLAAENYVKEFTSRHFIIRSTWVYGNGHNFVNYVLDEAEKKGEVSAATDQFASPTSADELAKFIVYLLKTQKYGVYHATCTGRCSRYDLAKKVLELSEMNVPLHAVHMDETEYTVPHLEDATLENFIMELEHDYDFPSWEEALEAFMKRRNN